MPGEQVQMLVTIQIGDREITRGIESEESWLAKGAVTLSQHYQHVVIGLFHDNVQVPILIEISHHEAPGNTSGRKKILGLLRKVSVSVLEKDLRALRPDVRVWL